MVANGGHYQKNSVTGIQSILDSADGLKMGRYRGFSKNFKNTISSIYKVIDITSIKVHPDATGARRANGE